MFVRQRLAMLAVAAAALFSALPVTAQQTTGTFRGRITGPDGEPVQNAQVTVRSAATGFERSVLADVTGRYLVPLVPPGGSYTVTASSIGFGTAERPDFRVSAGDVVVVDIQLTVQAVQLQGIEVLGAAQRVDVTQTGVVQRVGQQQIENLPVNGRDFVDFLALSALVSPQPEIGTGGQFSIGGARTSGTNIQVDGADANNVFFGENRGSSRSPFAFSLESIREFQLITNGWDVEYGNYQGGVMNAVTRGGTNDFRGSLFYYNRNEGFTASDFNLAPPTDFKVHQFGASISGPVLRDRLHFFASVDGQQKEQPTFASTASSANVSDTARARFLTALSTYGVTNPEQYYGVFQQTQDNLVLFGRLDWTINGAHRLTLRQNYSNFEQLNDRVAGNEAVTGGGPFRDKVYSTVAELNSVFSPSLFNTLRFQFSYEERPREPFPDGGYLPEIRVNNVEGNNRLSFGGDGTIFRNRLEESKLQLVNNLTWRTGAHTFKLGTNNILSNTLNMFWLAGNGLYTFNNMAVFQAQTPSQYSRSLRACPVPLVANAAGETVICPQPDIPIAEFNSLEWSVYAQDDVQLSDRLTVSGGVRVSGLRYNEEPQRVEAVEQAFTVPGTQRAVRTGLMPDFVGVSPRLSFSYDMSGDRPAAFRGGVGLLTGRIPNVLPGNVFQTERPLLSISCTGTQVPTLNLQELLASPTGLNNPAACRSGAAPTGRPEYTIFGEDFKMPKTLKANIGYERVLPTDTRINLDFIFAESWHMYTVRDLNIPDPVFTLDFEGGRPVYVPAAGYNPANSGSVPARLRNPNFARIYYNTSDGEARQFNANVTVDHRFFDALTTSLSYGYNRAYDNSSFSCCTSGEGFTGETTWGDPNFLGDPGDDERGAWGVSRFERRHVIVGSAQWTAPLGIRVNGIWRSQSGTPWTPVVQGDLNADGQSFNERAFVSREHLFASPEDAQRFEQIVQDFSCIADQMGRVAARNSCRNPWWHTMDLRLAKEFQTVRGQRIELLADLFNVIDGIGNLFCDKVDADNDGRLDNAGKGACGWGDYRAVYSDATNLLTPCTTQNCAGQGAYDAASNKVRYRVVYDRDRNTGFGAARPSGFDPFQFQAQIGLRYRF